MQHVVNMSSFRTNVCGRSRVGLVYIVEIAFGLKSLHVWIILLQLSLESLFFCGLGETSCSDQRRCAYSQLNALPMDKVPIDP